MALERRTALQSTVIEESGRVFARLALGIFDTTAGQWASTPTTHVVEIKPGQVASERLADVTLNIAENGYPPIPSGVEEKISAHVEREHTPEVVAAFKAAGGARRAARAEAGGGAAIP